MTPHSQHQQQRDPRVQVFLSGLHESPSRESWQPLTSKNIFTPWPPWGTSLFESKTWESCGVPHWMRGLSRNICRTNRKVPLPMCQGTLTNAQPEKSTIAEHTWGTGHAIDWDEVQIKTCMPHFYKRVALDCGIWEAERKESCHLCTTRSLVVVAFTYMYLHPIID